MASPASFADLHQRRSSALDSTERKILHFSCFSCLGVHLEPIHLEVVLPSWQAADFEMSNCPFPAVVFSMIDPSFSVVPLKQQNSPVHPQHLFSGPDSEPEAENTGSNS